MLKFSANLGFLFAESNVTLVEQYKFAKAAGFKSIEHPFPAKNVDFNQLKEALGDMKVALVNIDVDSDAKFGCAALPGRQDLFRKNLHNTLEFAKKFDCKKIHLMSGKLECAPTKSHHETFIENLKYAAVQLELNSVYGVIEPINHYSVPNYYLNNYEFAIDVIKQIGSPNLKLMLDLFHAQMIRGNIVNAIKDYQQFIGHVQIAQAPDRHEPDSNGELNFKFILHELENIGYADYIGCEYKPLTTTTEGLNWISKFGYTL